MHPKPKKSLGQNFLIDRNIQRKIIAACIFSPSDIVLEIGAGRGELTQQIIPLVGQIFAVELDRGLLGTLEEKVNSFSNIKIIKQDILKLNLKNLFSDFKKKIKVVGNIPYYISTPILERLIMARDVLASVFITVQKEYARRIVSLPGSKDYGALSCFVQYYTEPRVLFSIKKTSFYPQPKVDSCFLCLKIKRALPLKKKKEALLFKIIRAAFNQRRKILKNSLQGVLPEGKLDLFLQKSGKNRNIRPEELSLEDFIQLV